MDIKEHIPSLFYKFCREKIIEPLEKLERRKKIFVYDSKKDKVDLYKLSLGMKNYLDKEYLEYLEALGRQLTSIFELFKGRYTILISNLLNIHLFWILCESSSLKSKGDRQFIKYQLERLEVYCEELFQFFIYTIMAILAHRMSEYLSTCRLSTDKIRLTTSKELVRGKLISLSKNYEKVSALKEGIDKKLTEVKNRYEKISITTEEKFKKKLTRSSVSWEEFGRNLNKIIEGEEFELTPELIKLKEEWNKVRDEFGEVFDNLNERIINGVEELYKTVKEDLLNKDNVTLDYIA